MTPEALGAWLDRWSLMPVEGAKVLKINKSKMSEYLKGAREVPVYIEAHIATFDSLSQTAARKIIKDRLDGEPRREYRSVERV